MKKTLIILTLFVSVFLFSCKEVGDAKSVVDNFYEYRQSKDYDKILDLLSSNIFQYATEEQIISDLKAIDKSMGSINTYKSNGLNVSSINGQTTTNFTYKVVYDKGVMIDSIALLKEDGAYKIYYYRWQKQ